MRDNAIRRLKEELKDRGTIKTMHGLQEAIDNLERLPSNATESDIKEAINEGGNMLKTMHGNSRAKDILGL